MWRDLRGTLALMALLLCVLALAPLAAPYDALALSGTPQMPPSGAHVLGTDMIGRDVLSRVLAGAAYSVGGAMLSAAAALGVGTALAIAVEMRLPVASALAEAAMRAALALPALILALALTTLTGSGVVSVALATGLAHSSLAGAMTRTLLSGVRVQPYVEAAVSLGAGRLHVIRWHMLPNTLPVLLVYAIVLFSYAMIANGALLFLGLGGDPALPEWGAMLAEGRFVMRGAPWAAIAPGMALMLAVLVVNALAARLQRIVLAAGV